MYLHNTQLRFHSYAQQTSGILKSGNRPGHSLLGDRRGKTSFLQSISTFHVDRFKHSQCYKYYKGLFSICTAWESYFTLQWANIHINQKKKKASNSRLLLFLSTIHLLDLPFLEKAVRKVNFFPEATYLSIGKPGYIYIYVYIYKWKHFNKTDWK